MQKICLELANKTEHISKMLKTQISCEAIKSNNTKTHYYTGLPSYKHFELCLALIKPYMKIHGKNVLASEDQLLLTLRLNLVEVFQLHQQTLKPPYILCTCVLKVLLYGQREQFY